MLSPDDVQLVERDRALPGLATLLDEERFAAELRAATLLGQSVRSATILYVRYKPGTSCLASYCVDTEQGPIELHAIAYSAEDVEKSAKPPKDRAEPTVLGSGHLLLPQQLISITPFPNDAEIAALHVLGSTQQTYGLVRAVIPSIRGMRTPLVLRLAYKPQRRYVARVLGDGSSLVLKLYADAEYEAAELRARSLTSVSGPGMQSLVGSSDRLRALGFEWIAGRNLTQQIRLGDDDAVRSAGASLRRLHQCSAEHLPALSRTTQLGWLQSNVAMVSALVPELSDRASRLAERLGTDLESAGPVGTIHGDFYAEQVLWTEDGQATLLDLDAAASGPHAADLGNFIAHLESHHLNGELHAGRISAIRAALLKGYAQAGGRIDFDPGLLAVYTACALLRLAPQPFRRRQQQWGVQIAALLDRAEAITDGKTQLCSASQRLVSRSIASAVPRVHLADDEPMAPLLEIAVDPQRMRVQLDDALRREGSDSRIEAVHGIHLTRYKPARRCLIEYDIQLCDGEAQHASTTLVGKIRGKGLDRKSYEVQRSLWRSGFGVDAEHGVSVPQPVGTVPELNMWLQRKIAGVSSLAALTGDRAEAAARRVAEAAAALHRFGSPPRRRRHALADEMRILGERLRDLANSHPDLEYPARRLWERCEQLARTLPKVAAWRPIHRDFYHDQLLVGRDRWWLVDLDLYCEGNPELDTGNFIAHLTEHALRQMNDPRALLRVERIIRDHYLEVASDLAGPDAMRTIDVFAALSLARLVQISTRIPGRQHSTAALLTVCDQKLNDL